MTRNNRKIPGLVIEFITARHYGEVRTAKKVQATLKQLLGRSFTKTMLKYGDPDIDGYDVVLKRWEVTS